MKFGLSFYFLLIAVTGFAQSLSSLNLDYWHNPNAELEFLIAPVQTAKQQLVYYQLITNRKESPASSYSIDWENRETLNDKTGLPISNDSIISQSTNSRIGVLALPTSSKIWYITAKVTNLETQAIFYFYKPVDPLWPVNNFTMVDGSPWLKDFLTAGSHVSLGIPAKKVAYGFLFKKNFSAALPPFAEAEKTDPFLKADSTFVLDQSFVPKTNGLYLIQEDTTSGKGISFMVMNPNYPKYTRVELLAAPLIYLTTDDEFNELTAAQSNKAAFDKVILEITRDKERAKSLMRSYFQRVETANRYFTEYKEGWKTDRGMIYVIYGQPDEVSRTAITEIWFYRTQKTKFVFNRSGSIFCPENYKLQRDKEHTQQWFYMVDLWRKGKF